MLLYVTELVSLLMGLISLLGGLFSMLTSWYVGFNEEIEVLDWTLSSFELELRISPLVVPDWL